MSTTKVGHIALSHSTRKPIPFGILALEFCDQLDYSPSAITVIFRVFENNIALEIPN